MLGIRTRADPGILRSSDPDPALLCEIIPLLLFRSMRIGKILVDSDSETHTAHIVFAKFPDDIANRFVNLSNNI